MIGFLALFFSALFLRKAFAAVPQLFISLGRSSQKEESFLKLFFQQIQDVLFKSTLRRHFFESFFSWQLSSLKAREYILAVCLSPLAWLLPVLFSFLVFQMSPVWPLGLAFVLVLTKRYGIFKACTQQQIFLLENLISIFTYFGFALLFFEVSTRYQLSLRGFFDLFFTRPYLLTPFLFLIGFLTPWIFKLEFLSLTLSWIFWISGWVPVTSAGALIFGEICFWGGLFFVRTRSSAYFPLRGQFLLMWFLSIAFGFWISNIISQQTQFWLMEEPQTFSSRMLYFVVVVLSFQVTMTVLLMGWGHWAAKKLQSAQILSAMDLSPTELEEGLLSELYLQTVTPQLQKKLQQLSQHRKDLSAEDMKHLPKPVQVEYFKEMERLDLWLKKLPAHLSSRSLVNFIFRD